MTKLVLSGLSRLAHWTRFKEEVTTLMRSNLIPAKIVPTNEVIGLVQNDGYSAWQELLSRYYPCPDDLNIK